MNLFQVGSTKDGRMVITFSKQPEAQQVLAPVVAQLFSIACGGSLPITKEAQPTQELRAAKRGRLSTSDVKLTLVPQPDTQEKKEKALIQYEYDRSNLTPEQRSHDDQRLEIDVRMREYCELYRGTCEDQVVCTTYTRMYKLFNAERGYYPSRRTAMPYLGHYVPTKLNTLIIDGMGKEFISFINREIRKLKGIRAR